MLVTASGELAVSYRLDPEPVQVGRAREQTRKFLPGLGLGEHADLAELIVSELVTNAMVHGEGQIEVRLSCACGDLRAEVHDDGADRPVRQCPGTDDERGRGLELIEGPDRAVRRRMGSCRGQLRPRQDRLRRRVPRLRSGRPPMTAMYAWRPRDAELPAAVDAAFRRWRAFRTCGGECCARRGAGNLASEPLDGRAWFDRPARTFATHIGRAIASLLARSPDHALTLRLVLAPANLEESAARMRDQGRADDGHSR